MLPVGGVKVVLDAVVRAARQLLGDVGPLVAELLVQAEDFMLLFAVDGVFLDVGVQMIVPSNG